VQPGPGDRQIPWRRLSPGFEYLQALGKPQLAQIGPITYAELLAPIDAQLAKVAGWHWEIRTRSLPVLTPGAIDAIMRAVARKTSPPRRLRFTISMARLPHLRYPAATPTLWGRMTANRQRMLMATTPPGSAPSNVASIPIGSLRLRSRCRWGRPFRLRSKRISGALQSNRSLAAADCSECKLHRVLGA
jgi:hypothetical protein